MPTDLTIIAIVFALVLLLVFFSAVVLYLAFRVKETFRKETRRGSTIVKTAFLIGVLFLAGGLFYFFGNSLTTVNQSTPTPNAFPTPTPTFSPSDTTTPTPSPNPNSSDTPSVSTTPVPSSTTPSPTPVPSTTPQTPIQGVSFTASYPPTAKMSTQITVTFTIVNSAGFSVQGATIQTNVFFQDFSVLSCNYPVVGNVINVGTLPTGTTIVSLQLTTPSRPVNFDDTVSLVYEGMPNPITQAISISVRGS